MEDLSCTFSNLHHHHSQPSFHQNLPDLQSSELGYQPAVESLEQCVGRGEDAVSAASFPMLGSSSGVRRRSSADDRGFHAPCIANMDGDMSMRGHSDKNGGFGGHYADIWFGACKKEKVWDDLQSCESPVDDLHDTRDGCSITNGVAYSLNFGTRDALRRKLSGNDYGYSQVSGDVKRETFHHGDANFNHCPNSKRSAGTFSDSSADYCRRNSRGSDYYIEPEEDYGANCGSGKDSNQAADVDVQWLNASHLSRPEGRSRREGDPGPPQRSPVNSGIGTYPQKLDSFSEAFLSQRKRRFPVISSGDSAGQSWKSGPGNGEIPMAGKSRYSCGFDSDSYPPSSFYSSSGHGSLPSFPSPPSSSHIMSSVLSPPPTPRPPPSHSPPKMDSPVSFGGNGHPLAQEEEPLSTLQFFNSRLQALPPVLSSGMLWKFPLLPHCFPQSPGDPSSNESNMRSPHDGDYVQHDSLQSPDSLLASSTHHSSSHVQPTGLSPMNTSLRMSCPPLPLPLPLQSPPPHLLSLHSDAAEKTAPYTVTQKVKNGQAALSLSQPQQKSIYTGTPFPSVLHSTRGQKRGHYTPRPLLNPVRPGTGLLSSLSLPRHEGDYTAFGADEEEWGVTPCVNVGHQFQAELPPLCSVESDRSVIDVAVQESSREELLWKPWEELEESQNLHNQVEKLMSLCSSSCLPGGGSNTELALHCLHSCRRDMMATLEMLLFWQPSPAGDYHYSGSDFWTDSEKSVFSEALKSNGKDFSHIQKRVRSKTVSQCVEFYYLSRKLLDKQKKQREENVDAELGHQKSVTPICQPVERQFTLVETGPVPPLASFFPCKICGKMFYKIKSRNAHMKIHRQPQEDWTNRRLQQQLLSQRLSLSCSTNLLPPSGGHLLPPEAPALTFSSSTLSDTSSNTSNTGSIITNVSVLDPSTAITYTNMMAASTHRLTTIDAGDSNHRDPHSVPPFQQSWVSFGHSPGPAAFEYNTEVKAVAVGEEESIGWQ